MPSIVDEMFFKEGVIDPDFIGVSEARAGDMIWHRERGESEPAFLARARMGARAEGFALVSIAGHLPVSDLVKIY